MHCHRRRRTLVGAWHEIAYHAYPFGYIVGEIVRRTTGKPISHPGASRGDIRSSSIADEIYFGVPRSELGRLARLEDMEGSAEMRLDAR